MKSYKTIKLKVAKSISSSNQTGELHDKNEKKALYIKTSCFSNLFDVFEYPYLECALILRITYSIHAITLFLSMFIFGSDTNIGRNAVMLTMYNYFQRLNISY
jgi:hypothetical protein